MPEGTYARTTPTRWPPPWPHTCPGLQLHPNDDVNASRSSNGLFPTTHLAATESLITEVIPALEPATGRRSSRPGARTWWTLRRSRWAGGGRRGLTGRDSPPGCATCCRGWPSCLSAAPRSAPDANAPDAFAAGAADELRAVAGLEVLTETPTTWRLRVPGTAGERFRDAVHVAVLLHQLRGDRVHRQAVAARTHAHPRVVLERGHVNDGNQRCSSLTPRWTC
jgi:hypothetical protein